jgi:tripartite-type tricarboxylate transporter receptor subunit TctC
MVVPFPPGGAADITARLPAEQMAPLLNQPVVIGNRPSIGGNIAAEVVVRLHQATTDAARSPAFADTLLPLGFAAIMDDSPAALTELIGREDAVWKGLVELSGVRLD